MNLLPIVFFIAVVMAGWIFIKSNSKSKIDYQSEPTKLKNKKSYTPNPSEIIIGILACIVIVMASISYIFTHINLNHNQTINQKTEINNSNSNSNTDNLNSSFHCSICGKIITGRGYKEISNGVWEVCEYPNQCQICSPECGRKHTAEMNTLIDKTDESSGLKCSHCGFGHYVNGYCNYCGTASQTTVDRHQVNYPKCEMCSGTGFVHVLDGNNICPSCNGTGKQNY